LVGVILLSVNVVRDVGGVLDLLGDVDVAGHFERRAAGAVLAVEE
jgi:hypothetical protein